MDDLAIPLGHTRSSWPVWRHMTVRRVADAFSSFVAVVFEIESGLVVKMEVLNSNDFVLPLMLDRTIVEVLS
jgi:hypothetical protein